MDRHFLHLVDTANGTKAAPPYTKLFIGHHKETIQVAFIWAILSWRTFIGNMFLISLGTTNQL